MSAPGLSTTISRGSAPGRIQVWTAAARPSTLWAAAAPVVVGLGYAARLGELRWWPAIATMAGALLIQIGTNFVNDVADAVRGADTSTRLGPARAVQSGWLTADQMRHGAAVVLFAALLIGIYLASVTEVAFLGVWTLSILAGVAYTAGPFPLAYNGLGDLFVFLFFGLVAVVGTVYIQTGALLTLAWLLAIPIGSLATGILVVNNLRDIRGDERARKRTLAVRFGRRWARREYWLLIVVSYTTALALALSESLWFLLPFLSVPFAVRLISKVETQDGAALNPVLGGTARLLVLFAGLEVIACLL